MTQTGSRLMRWRRFLWKTVRILLVVYLVAAVMAWFFEDRLVFIGSTVSYGWANPKTLEPRDVDFTLADGTHIRGWWCPKPEATGAVLYCHGNGGNVSLKETTYLNLQKELNVSVLAIDYPGYGKSGGRASEANCYESAQVAFDWLTTEGHIAPECVILFGESLGGGIVTELATRRPCRALVLFCTFTTVRDAAHGMYPFLPCRLAMRNRFDNLAKLPTLTQPVFIAHGDKDGLISISHSRKLREVATSPCELYVEPGASHAPEPSPAFYAALRKFLAQHAPK